jgi:uncharacterized protein YjbI with pentapeptide repeats
MANQKHLEILHEGVEAWNKWRRENPAERPNLSGVDLSAGYAQNELERQIKHEMLMAFGLDPPTLLTFDNYDFRGADLSNCDLSSQSFIQADLKHADLTGAHLEEARLLSAYLQQANLTGAYLSRANLSLAQLQNACLQSADFSGAQLFEADLSDANLTGSYLRGANLYKATLHRADLTRADLTTAILVQTDLSNATLQGCRVYGMAAWDLILLDTRQSELIVTAYGEPEITVDNLSVAQFVYLLLNNSEIREAIDTIGKKVVLILGRFTPERKVILDTIRSEVSKHNYVPIMFDFEKPGSRSFIETVSILAKMSRFVIADVTDAKVIIEELAEVVPNNPSVPVQLLAQKGEKINVTIGDFGTARNMLPKIFFYQDVNHVLSEIYSSIIAPAESRVNEIADEFKLFQEQIEAANS